jgi:class 3 adenylate cyclase
MADASEAGAIRLGAATAATLPGSVLGAEKAGGLLLKRQVEVASAALEPLPDVNGIPLADCVPAAIRDYVSQTTIEPEHRQVAVAFIRFTGTDALLARDGPASTAAALQQLVETVQAAADEHHVSFLETDIDRDGGRIILVAGAPQSAGDDEERMLRAVRSIADAELPFPLHIGVNRGRVFVGEVGAAFRRTYTIMGETAALAARLMSKAGPGSVLTTADVLERSRGRFATVELEPFQAKGKTEPIVPFDVTGTAEGRTDRRGDVAFTGRERELAILGASLAPVRMGFGSLVELIGHAGMGKSRLVEELLSQCGDMQTVSTVCEEYEVSTPYFPFRALLRSLLQVPVDGDAAPTAERLRARLAPLAPEVVPWIPLLALPLDIELESTPEVDDLQPSFQIGRAHV